MRPSTGRWVTGDDFFDREIELQILEARLRDCNDVVLTGQRRMGKTSVARELGRRLANDGWIFLYANVEGASCAEDAISTIAKAVHPVRSIASRIGTGMRRWAEQNIQEISAGEFALKVRAEMDGRTWRSFGEKLFTECADYERPILLVIDELPFCLKRMLETNGRRQVDDFLSWFRATLQHVSGGSLRLIVTGSIGLLPFVRRLRLPDRINHLDSVRLGPWDRPTSVKCFENLAKAQDIQVQDGVAEAVYELLGLGIPHHVQSFFACLRDFGLIHRRNKLTVDDVEEVYRNELLGPAGQANLVHYESRLKEGLDEEDFPIAMEILAEAATQDTFTPRSRRCLATIYSALLPDAPNRISEVLEILEHDGYLERRDEGYRIPSNLLKDWWSARFRDHHVPLSDRFPEDSTGSSSVR